MPSLLARAKGRAGQTRARISRANRLTPSYCPHNNITMKSGIHLQKKLRQVVTKDGAIVTYRLVHFPKQNSSGLTGLSIADNLSTEGSTKLKTKTITAPKK